MPIKLVANFDQCPVCGSTKRFGESLANEIRERGLASEDFRFYVTIHQGAVVDKSKERSIPIGSEFPVLIACTDICLDCGTLYAVQLQRDTVKKTLVVPPRPMGPNNLRRN